MRGFGLAIAALCTLLLSGCGYNELQRKDEQVKAAWAEVLNQYQRRADLVPNLVNTVKGYAAQEQQVLRQVTEARARVGSIQATLEGTENRIAVARNRYIKAVEEYNVTVRSFPTNLTAMLFGFKPKPTFTVENERELAKPPRVDFERKAK